METPLIGKDITGMAEITRDKHQGDDRSQETQLRMGSITSQSTTEAIY
jgi:hypothetical protein